jgi:antigen flippase
MSSEKSYAQILRASSIMGGAAGINLLLGMVRVKFAAVLIGATGVGLNTSFAAVHGLIGTLAGIGIHSSAVREIASAAGRNDEPAIGRVVVTLRRLSWLTGLLGMAAMMLLAPLLSLLTFGHRDYALEIAALGFVILFGNLSGGQMALIQGMRRIGDLARADVIGAMFGTVAAIGFYATLGLRGIIPTLVAVSAFQLALSWHFARRVPVPKTDLTLRQTFAAANGMMRLGLVFMTNGLMTSAVAYVTVALITQYEGTQAVGLYSAAFALSGMFVNFVLGAMGSDYYPRLTAAADDKATMTRMVNEQTEIGLLLTVPGLLATLALAPWILQIFYTSEFLGAVELLQWFLLGCMGRVISWPLGYIMLALGKSSYLLVSELLMNAMHICLIFVGLQAFGVIGVAYAFVFLYVLHICVTLYIAKHLTHFSWTPRVKATILLSSMAIALILVSSLQLSQASATLAGAAATLLSLITSISLILKRTESHNSTPILKKFAQLLHLS